MGVFNARGGVREAQIGVVIRRADGRIEDHGRIAFSGPLWRWLLWKIERLTIYRLKRLYWRLR
jgi:hypothetical protein